LQSLKAANTYHAEARDFCIFSNLDAGVARANMDSLRQQAIASQITSHSCQSCNPSV